MPQPAHRTILPARLQPQHPQRLRHYHSLPHVVRWWYALECLQALHCFGAALGFVRDHATDCTPEHLGWGAVVPWAAAFGVVAGLLAEEGLVLYCSSWRSYVSRCSRWVGDGGFAVSGGDIRLALKNSPEMLRASQRTTTIFWPLRSCLATVLARRPRRWPLPSTTTCWSVSFVILGPMLQTPALPRDCKN